MPHNIDTHGGRGHAFDRASSVADRLRRNSAASRHVDTLTLLGFLHAGELATAMRVSRHFSSTVKHTVQKRVRELGLVLRAPLFTRDRGVLEQLAIQSSAICLSFGNPSWTWARWRTGSSLGVLSLRCFHILPILGRSEKKFVRSKSTTSVSGSPSPHRNSRYMR